MNFKNCNIYGLSCNKDDDRKNVSLEILIVAKCKIKEIIAKVWERNYRN